MKRLFIFTLVYLSLLSTVTLLADERDEKENYSLKGKNIIRQGELLDKDYQEAARRMGEIIKRYNLLANSNIVTLPFQVEYTRGKNYISMEKHSFERSAFERKKITSFLKKSITIYTDGSRVQKIITQVYRKDYRTGLENQVTLVDPEPEKGGTGDITITQVKNGTTVFNKKKLGDFSNTTASPIQNELKRDFLISHISTFADYLLFIGESHDREMKDRQREVKGFMKTAMKQ